jgi:hypothetical protein
MLKIISQSQKSLLAASFLVFAGTWNIPKVDAVNTYNLGQINTNSNIIAAVPVWKKFSPEKGQFSILMPNDKVDYLAPDASQKNQVSESTKMYLSTHEQSIFIVSHSDFKNDQNPVPANELLDSAIEGMLEGKKKLLSQKDITLGTHPGREIVIRDEKEAITLTGRVFIINERMYILLVGGDKSPEANDISKFLNSFELIK